MGAELKDGVGGGEAIGIAGFRGGKTLGLAEGGDLVQLLLAEGEEFLFEV